MTPLNEYRESIDNLDSALIGILAERFKITRKVGLYKAEHSLPEKDTDRETRQMEKIDLLSKRAGLRPEIARSVLRLVIDRVIDEHTEIRKGYFRET